MALRDDLLNPIAGDDPGGESLRYDPIYDRIKDARREDPFADPPVRADWRLVTELTGEAIAKKSKDLQLAAWLTESLLRREGIAGLRQGLELVNQLIDKFWDHLHPLIEDGDTEMRAAPLTWLASYLDAAVRLSPVTSAGHSYTDYKASRNVPTKDEAEAESDKAEKRQTMLADGVADPDEIEKGFVSTPKAWYKQLIVDIDACGKLVEAIEKTGDAKLGSEAPSFRTMRTAMQELRVGVGQLLSRKLELDPDPPEEEPIDLEPEGDGVISLEPRNREDASRRIAAVAKFLRGHAPADPASYLMLRGFRWGELRTNGGIVDPLMLAAPPTEVRTRLKGMLLRSQWKELLEAGEEIMATPFGRGWLDLQRYILTACDGLGAEFNAVSSAIRGALRSLLQDIPGLPDMTLMDDLPTATGETRTWLYERAIIGGSADVVAEPEPRETGPSLDSVDRMLQQVGTGQPQRAIELLMRAAAQEKSERARFLRRSEAARIMVASGLEAVAKPILEQLIGLVESHNLEDWESGDTVAQPIGLLYRCLTRVDPDNASRQDLYLRVCRLDPLLAMQLTSDAQAAAANEQQG
jgi:type VI secretion system protein ImpA